MKTKLPLFFTTALLALCLSACTVEIGFSYGDTSADPTSVRDDGSTAVPPADTKVPNSNTTDPAQTPASTTTAKPVTESTHPYKDETVQVKNPSVVVNADNTFTGDPPLADITYTVIDPQNKLGLSTQKFSHAFGAAKNGQPHSITVENQKRFDEYGLSALTWDNKTEEKVLYLTFDCGYEYKNLTSEMLDTLKEKGVTATFFCTLDYLEQAPAVVARMIKEGHIVGNHSTTHPSDCSALTREEMAWEILGVHNYLRTNFGYECRYFRFPAGNYTESVLEVVQSVGYRTAFWSIAHADWDPENQPGVQTSFNTVTSRLHPGAVILLHTTAPDNAAILGDFIDYARAQGYEFRSLDDYEYWDS
ncbi:MAG: polysaccharide deacetylase family protein [Clostridia bacterium]|nr:polysaccharide deacetylase family protein [Clostridia bacterium]